MKVRFYLNSKEKSIEEIVDLDHIDELDPIDAEDAIQREYNEWFGLHINIDSGWEVVDEEDVCYEDTDR